MMGLSYLAKCDLHSPQVIIIPKVRGGVVNVIDRQLQILNSLKVIIQSQSLTEGWIRRVV